jgi:hypothetical protein
MGFEYDHISANQYLTLMEKSKDPEKRKLSINLKERLNNIILDYQKPIISRSANNGKIKWGKGISLNNTTIKRKVMSQIFKKNFKPPSPGRSVEPSRRRPLNKTTEQ